MSLPENNDKEFDLNKKIRADLLGQRVVLLFSFCAQLIPDLDLLNEISEYADKNHSLSMTLAPVMEAFNKDPEYAEFEARIKQKRAAALRNLVQVLADTEVDKIKFAEKMEKAAAGRKIVEQILNEKPGKES